MSTVSTTRMTAEEFWDWIQRPENAGHRWELIDGEVEEVPPPGDRHNVLCALIAMILFQFAFKRGKGRVQSNDSGVIVSRNPDTVRGADVVFYDEMKKFDEVNVKWSPEPPQLVVEVLSPTDRPGKTNRRITQYLRRGVPLVWLVDPETHTVTTYRKGRDLMTLDETEELTGEDVLPDFRCKVADLFTLPGA